MKKKKKLSPLYWVLIALIVFVFALILIAILSKPSALQAPYTLQEYMTQANKYTSDLSDSQIINIINNGKNKLSSRDRSSLSTISNANWIDIARGTQQGFGVVAQFTPAQELAANNLYLIIQGELMAGSYSGIFGSCLATNEQQNTAS